MRSVAAEHLIYVLVVVILHFYLKFEKLVNDSPFFLMNINNGRKHEEPYHKKEKIRGCQLTGHTYETKIEDYQSKTQTPGVKGSDGRDGG